MSGVKKLCHNAACMLAILLTLCLTALWNGNAAFAAETDSHKLTYLLDGEVFMEEEYQAGETVAAPEAPEKEQFVFSGWKDLPEVMPAEDLTVTGAYQFAGTLVTDLENVYKCELDMGGTGEEQMKITMYLRINEDGDFVFSRDTDFSKTEKGAGKVYKKTPAGELVSGDYMVDISWSPMADMLDPILHIDAETMTFTEYGASDPSVVKGSGTISLDGDRYTLHFADSGDTTAFTYEDGVLTFTSKLWYGSASFNNVDEAGDFSAYTAALDGDTLKEEAEETSGEEVAENEQYYLVYYVVNGETVAEGDYISEFEIGQDGSLQFVTPMWFGATEPKLEAEDGSISYPLFTITEEELAADIVQEAIVSKSTAAAAGDQTEKDGAEEGEGSLTPGTYGGSHNTTAMGNPLTYAVSLTIQGNGSYSYTVTFNVMGSARTESESGTYTVNGNTVSFVSSSGTSFQGTISGNSITITRKVSSFAFSPASVTLTLGVTGSASGSADMQDNSSGSQQDTDGTEPQEELEKEPGNDTKAPVVNNKNGLVSGEYYVDISWSPMENMFQPVLKINAKKMTFQLYNQGDTKNLKGSGKISYKKGVFTLKYEDGKKTTFTFEDGVISFTSKLWYGNASFNNEGKNGKFKSFTAKTKKGSKPDKNPADTEPATEPSTNPATEPETEPGTGTETGLKAGSYRGSMTTDSMGGMAYQYTITFDGKGNYQYTVKLTTPFGDMTQSETGTYTESGNTLKLTVKTSDILDAGQELTAVLNGNSLSMTRKLASMGTAEYSVTFTYDASTGSGDTEKPTEAPDTERPDETPIETPTEQPTEKPGETEEDPGVDKALKSGTYAVDISWSPMAGMFKPILVIDAENMQFNIYNEGAPADSKGNGTISYANGVYTLNYTMAGMEGKMTTFTSSNGVIRFTSLLWYGGAKFNNVDGNGNFVPFEAKQDGQNQPEEPSTEEPTESETESETEAEPGEETELKSGTYAVDMTGTSVVDMMGMKYPMLEVDTASMTFYLYDEQEGYYISKGEGSISYADGVYTLEYANGKTTTFTCKGGSLYFTSCLYYGAVKLGNWADDDPDYNFVPYPNPGKFVEGSEPEEKPEEPVELKTGLYGGTIDFGTSSYRYTLELGSDGNYLYKVENFSNKDETILHSAEETGTYSYTADRNELKLTVGSSTALAAGTEIIGQVGSGSQTITMKRKSIEMHGEFSLTFTYGWNPFEDKYEPEESESESEEDKPSVQAGTYAGTISTDAMGGMQYLYSLILDGKGNYQYSVELVTQYGNQTQTETGTYTTEGNTISLTVTESGILEAGTNLHGTVNGNQIVMTRKLASMGSAEYEAIFTLGATPEATLMFANIEKAETEEETESEAVKEAAGTETYETGASETEGTTEEAKETETETAPATEAGTETEDTAEDTTEAVKETEGMTEDETEAEKETGGMAEDATEMVKETEGMTEDETETVKETEGMTEDETETVKETESMAEDAAETVKETESIAEDAAEAEKETESTTEAIKETEAPQENEAAAEAAKETES